MSDPTTSSPSSNIGYIAAGVFLVIGIIVALVVVFAKGSSSSQTPPPPSNPNQPPYQPPYQPPNSSLPPPHSPAAPPCDPSGKSCANDSYPVCHPDGYPVCVECSTYVSDVNSRKCGSDHYPKCINGSVDCIACGDYSSVTCNVPGTYAQCGPDGKTSCVQCQDYDQVSATCAANEFAKCVNGVTTCVPCQNSTPVKCPFNQYSKCSQDGSMMTCVACGDYATSSKCADNKYKQCMGPSGGTVASTSCQTCTDFSSAQCNPGTYPVCQVSADMSSYKTTCISMCTNTINCGTDPNYLIDCDYSASPPTNKCKYVGPCKKTPPSCDADQVAVCGSDNNWSCQGAPVSVDVIASQYNLKAYPVEDLTGTCKNGPGGTCVVYASQSDPSLFAPVAPTRGVFNSTSGTACEWMTPTNSNGAMDTNAIKLINNPPYNLVWQGDRLTLVDVTKDSKYVSYIKTAASSSVPFDQVCYVPNTCDPSATKVSLDSSNNLVCTCDSSHYGPLCNFTSAQCSNVGIPSIGTQCKNCGGYQEGQGSMCECTASDGGGLGTLFDSLTSCTCPTDPTTQKQLYAGPTCQYSRAVDCNANGTPYYNADGTHGCICDPHFAGPSCLLSRGTCNNRGDPTFTNGVPGCLCDPTDPDKPAGSTCQYTRSNQCNNQGNPDSQGNCTCDPGFAGNQCILSRAGNCSGNGNPQNNSTCVCDPGFLGPQCQYSRNVTCHGHGDPNPANPAVCNSPCDPYYVGSDCNTLSVFQQIYNNTNQRYKIVNVSSGAQLQSSQSDSSGNNWNSMVAHVQPGDPNANNLGMGWKFVGSWPNYWVVSDLNTYMACLFSSQDGNMPCIDPYANFDPSTAPGYARFTIEPIDWANGICRLRNGNTGGTLMKLKNGSGCWGDKNYDCYVTAGDTGTPDDDSVIAQWKLIPM